MPLLAQAEFTFCPCFKPSFPCTRISLESMDSNHASVETGHTFLSECVSDRKMKLKKYQILQKGDEVYVVA